MKNEDIIKRKIGKGHGFKVPEGFLEPVRKDLLGKLPERKPVVAPRRTMWQTIRPYVYLAAMFMGLWCTMKIVTQMQTSRHPEVSLDNPPALVARAVTSPEVEAQLNIAQQANDVDIVGDVAANYDDMSDFEKDFDYQFTDEVEDIDVKAMQQEFAREDASDDDMLDDYDFDEFYYDYYASL